MMVAILAVLLFSVAALAVDLGNAWARGRQLQKQADITAIGAGSLLPMSTSDSRTDNEPDDIAARAAALLNENVTAGQVEVDAGDLLDSDPGNGRLEFLDSAGNACVDMCVQMRLTPPSAAVEFGLAGAAGFSGTDVQRSATVRVFSELPPAEKMIPLWLPSGCGYGPVDGDTAQGGSAAEASPIPTPTPTPSPTPSPTATASPAASESPSPSPTPEPAVQVQPVGSHTLGGSAHTVPAGGTVTISNYVIGNLANNTERASIRVVAPDGSHYIEYAASTDVPKTAMPVPPFEVGTEVSGTPGVWRAYAMVKQNGTNQPTEYSANHLTITVTGTPPPSPSATAGPSGSGSPSASDVPVGCVGQDRGNFGQLDSPRRDAGDSDRLAWNMAFGLDHQVVPFAGATEKQCAKANGGDAVPGAQLDDVSRNGNNCVIGDTGNDGPKLFDGLVAGVNGKPGRLDAGQPGVNCTGRTRTIGGHTINNDELSCFLRGGATLADIAQTTGVDDSMLDPSIVESPRFVWLPVVLANDRAQKGYQPIIDFAAGFITDATQTAAATEENGLVINGSSVKVIRIFVFNKAALPPTEQSPTTGYTTALGRPIVRLVG